MREELLQERKQMIYDFICDELYVPMKAKEIAIVLNVPKKQRSELMEVLDALVAEGKVEISGKGKYVKSEGKYLTGVYTAHPRGFGFVTVEGEDEDIFIPASQANGALHMDTVQVAITQNSSGRRKEGTITKIIARGTEQLVCTYEKSNTFGFAVPDNPRFAQDIFIPQERSKGAVSGHKVVVEITDYGKNGKKPEGKVVEIIGHINDPGTDIMSIVKSYDLPVEFSAKIMKQVENVSNEVSIQDMAGRMDLRDWQTVTIDGEDAKDLDDAITLTKEGENYKLGVHIADVSHYVTEGSPLDNDAFERGTSVYIADKVIPMLPKELSNGICSLNPGVDRLAFSCLMEISDKGTVKKYKFAKTVIRSRVQGVYSEVNSILDGTANAQIKRKYKDVIDCIPVMNELAQILIKKRKDRGAPDIKSSESKVICDENGICIDIKPRIQGVSEGIIEEFMLMANNSAAKVGMKKEIPFVYRVHENPPAEKIESLKTTLEALGINPLGINEKAEAKNFAKLLEETADDPKNIIINRIVLRTMAKAKYSEQPIGHFGLVMKEYAHFTSPIRRYADLSIHRILTDYVSRKGADKLKKKYGEFSVKAAAQATKTELSAVAAERSCEDFYAAEYMKKHIGEEFDGIISGVIGSGLFVELPNTVEGKIDVRSLSENYFEVRNGIALYDGVAGTMYTIGDKVRVKCINANVNLGQIDFELIKVYEDASNGDKAE